MTASELKTELKNRRFTRLFIFAGEEDYLKRHYIGELRRMILQDEKLYSIILCTKVKTLIFPC